MSPLLIGKKIAIEIKSRQLVQEKHLKGLRTLKEEDLFERYLVVSLDTAQRLTDDGIEIMPWKRFLDMLWQGALF